MQHLMYNRPIYVVVNRGRPQLLQGAHGESHVFVKGWFLLRGLWGHSVSTYAPK